MPTSSWTVLLHICKHFYPSQGCQVKPKYSQIPSKLLFNISGDIFLCLHVDSLLNKVWGVWLITSNYAFAWGAYMYDVFMIDVKRILRRSLGHDSKDLWELSAIQLWCRRVPYLELCSQNTYTGAQDVFIDLFPFCCQHFLSGVRCGL